MSALTKSMCSRYSQQPSHGVVQLTARSIITLNGHGAEHVNECSERTLAQEREYSRTLELKVSPAFVPGILCNHVTLACISPS